MASKTIKEFFAEYEKHTNGAIHNPGATDPEAIALMYAECFVGASPGHVTCARNDNEFRAALRQGMEFYRSIGTRSMKIKGLDETAIDELHSLATAHWVAEHQLKLGKGTKKKRMDFDVTYLVQMRDGEPRIFAYVSGDEMAAYREAGLIPDEAQRSVEVPEEVARKATKKAPKRVPKKAHRTPPKKRSGKAHSDSKN